MDPEPSGRPSIVSTEREIEHEISRMSYFLANSSEMKLPAAPESSKAEVITCLSFIHNSTGMLTHWVSHMEVRGVLTERCEEVDARVGQLLR